MAVDSPIYVYLDQLFSQTWVRLSEKLLNRSHRQELTSASGYQDALEEIFGGANADDRTRAKELYNLGMLLGPLINPRDSGAVRSTIPLGWSRVQSDNEVHTRLGYCAYAVGKCLSLNIEKKSVIEALSVVAAVCLFQCGVELPGRKWITFASVFRHIHNSYPKPDDIETVIWERWLAHGMVATLNDSSRGLKLIDDVVQSTPVLKLLIPRKDAPSLELNPELLASHIRNNGSFVGSSREKASLFWSGTAVGNRPRGIYSLSQIAASGLVSAVCAFEVSSLFSGRESPLWEMSQRDPLLTTPCVLHQLGTILSHEESSILEMEICMKKLSEGVAESLAFLRASESQSQFGSRVLYAHGTEGKVTIGIDQEFFVPKTQCIANPAVGDIVHFGPHQLNVKNVIDEGADWRIIVS
jgi:hypothetical protein